MKAAFQHSVFGLFCILSIVATAPARADGYDTGPHGGQWFTQIGAVVVNFEKKSQVSVAGVPAPGVHASPDNGSTVGLALGYYFTPNISAMAVLGRGPTTDITNGAGTRLGKMWYGAPSLVVDYHFTGMRSFQPFVGIGGTYIWVLDDYDAAITNLKVDSTFGFIMRAGAEVMMTDHYGFFFAANKILADTNASGFIGATPIAAKVELDPWIFQGGVTYRF